MRRHIYEDSKPNDVHETFLMHNSLQTDDYFNPAYSSNNSAGTIYFYVSR
jgi:hypothetical protein